jgi:hypothetical protein
MKRTATAAVATACFVVLSVAVASATWVKPASGSAAGKADALAKPVGTAAALGTTSIRVSWPAPSSGAQVAATYVVRRVSPAATVCTVAQPETTTSCDDTGLTAGTLYNYTTEATLGSSWTSGQSTQFAATTTTNLSFTVAKAVGGNATSNTAFNVTITAKNGAATDTTVTGSHTLVFSGPAASPSGTNPTYPATVAFAAGVGTASVTLMKAETVALTVTEASPARTGTSANITVDPGTATQFAVANPGTRTVGAAFNLGITAQDLRKNTATGYTGAKTIAFSDAATSPDGTAPTYPTGTNNVTFAAGSANPSIILFAAASTTVTVTQSSLTGTSAAFTVNGLGTISELVFTNCSANGDPVVPCFGSGVAVTNGGSMDGSVSLGDTYGNAPTVSAGAVWSVTLTSNNTDFVVTLSPVTITGPATQSSTAFHVKFISNGNASATITAHATSGSPSVTDDTMIVKK